MKKLLMGFLFLLVGCGGSSGGGGSRSVEVSGDIYNTGTPKMVAGAALITNPEDVGRFAAVNQGQPIEITTTVTNTGTESLTGLTVLIEIEDAVFLTDEFWVCRKDFTSLEGSAGVGLEVWTEYAEPLPSCEGAPKDTAWVCADYLPALDCDNPSYSVEYTPAGNGMWEASSTVVSLAKDESSTTTTGYAHDAIDIKADHIARWTVKDSVGNVLQVKEYLFDVI